MRSRIDVAVIGGGIAGVSAAARIANHADTLVIEQESALGYHSSGRSATFYHFGIGNDAVRGLTAASSEFFEAPPADYGDAELWSAKPALFIADEESLPELEALHREMDRFTTTISRVGPREMLDHVPVLKTGSGALVAGLLDSGGRKLDADALLQANARAFRRAGGEIRFDTAVRAIRRSGDGWEIETSTGPVEARVIVNAAGAWADEVAAMAGVQPLGLRPLRRTIISFDAPEGIDVADWPFTKTVKDDGFYMLPDAGRLLASPMDTTPFEPCDVQPDEYEIALAAWRVEEATTMPVSRIAAQWAGLRTFTADQTPAVGFAKDQPGFFWLAGQGGYGLQTSPAMALAAEALMFDLPWPEALKRCGVLLDHVAAARF